MNRGLLAPAALAAALCGCGPLTAEPTIEHGTAIDHGKALFEDPEIAQTDLNTYSCATCHADDASATTPVRTGGPLRGVTERPSYWGGHELDLLRAVNDCLSSVMLKDEIWTADDEEARAMYAYLESLPATSADKAAAPFTVVTTVKDLPAGDAKRGQASYYRACGTCHGPAHTGKDRLVERAAVLPEQTLEEHPIGKYTKDDQRLVFVEKARHGGFLGYTGQMPPFSLEKLSDADLADILQYLCLY
jgi:thiosulfate dehydrogenase